MTKLGVGIEYQYSLTYTYLDGETSAETIISAQLGKKDLNVPYYFPMSLGDQEVSVKLYILGDTWDVEL